MPKKGEGAAKKPKAPKAEKPAGPKSYLVRARPAAPERMTVRIGADAIATLGLKAGDRVTWNGATLVRVE